METKAQARVQALLDSLVADGVERGLQAVAFVNGKCVVHAWAGIANQRNGKQVEAETLFPVFSTSKGIAATVVHRLAERGLLDYDTPIASIWPEFGAHGKEQITLRQALYHASGIPQMPSGLTFDDLGDWATLCRAIAGLTPLWTPGTRIEYHAITYGWIVGEVACRISGRTFPQLLHEEIARPLGLETSLYIGMPDDAQPRVAFLEEPDAVVPEPTDAPQAIPYWLGPLADWMNRSDAQRTCAPASSGIMSAFAIAKHYAALLPGGVDGVTLLPPSRVKTATEPQKPDRPENEDYPKNFGLGYQIGGADSIYGGPSAFGHGGYGGSLGFADGETSLAVGITKNRFNQADSTRRIVNELRAALQ